MGEAVVSEFRSDQWRIKRGGALVFADAFRVDGSVAATLAEPTCLKDARACAALLYVAPDAEDCIDLLRKALDPFEAGASAWNGLLTARIVAPDAKALRGAVEAAVKAICPAPLPSVWAS